MTLLYMSWEEGFNNVQCPYCTVYANLTIIGNRICEHNFAEKSMGACVNTWKEYL